MPLPKDFSNQNLQGASLRDQNLSYASFVDSDLRGADFTGSDLTGANFTHVKTGITPLNKVLIFIAALAVSLLSGYIATVAGSTVQSMLKSPESKIRIAGYITCGLIPIFIVYTYLKGGRNAFMQLILPALILALIVAIAARISGLGTGTGMLYLILAIALTVVMFMIGTIARSAAGAVLSNILFIVVAIGGGMFGKSLGGGIGTVVMAISCALISKRALSGAKGFDSLRKLACWITSRFGTSFRNSKLTEADFSKSELRNSDFTNADVSAVQWGDSRKMNCIVDQNWVKSDGTKKNKKLKQEDR